MWHRILRSHCSLISEGSTLHLGNDNFCICIMTSIMCTLVTLYHSRRLFPWTWYWSLSKFHVARSEAAKLISFSTNNSDISFMPTRDPDALSCDRLYCTASDLSSSSGLDSHWYRQVYTNLKYKLVLLVWILTSLPQLKYQYLLQY